MNLLERLYTVEGMLGKEPAQGELPQTGEIYSKVMQVATPAMIDTVLVALISMVDTMMVSVLGSAAIAAVGITTQPRMIILATFLAINTGLTAVVARRRGQEDRVGANAVLGETLSLCSLISIIIAATGAFFSRPLLLFAGAQPDVIDMAVAYFQIIMVGIPFNIITFCINGAQRGCGNTKISMKINIVANLVNMFFNFLLIGGRLGFPALGVKGAAIATVLGNFVGFIMAIISIFGKNENYLAIEIHNLLHWKVKTLRPVLSVGLSAGVEQIFLRVGFFLYVKIVASLGTTAMATHNICQNILNLSFAFCDGMAMSASALFGQSLGQKRNDLALLYSKACQRIATLIACFIILLFVTGGKLIIGCFSNEMEILNTGYILLLIIAATAPFQALQFVISSCLRSAGDTKFTAKMSMFCVGFLRPGMAWVLCYPLGFGIAGAWFSYFLDQVLRYTLCQVRFLHGKWKKIVL